MLKKLVSLLLSARLHILQPTPEGITPDSGALLGLNALMRNANHYALTRVDKTTAGTAQALTAQEFIRGAIILAAGASGGFTIDLPTGTALIAQLGVTVPKTGLYSQEIFIKNNNVGQTGTVTVASGDTTLTLTGTMTIATNTTRRFLLTVVSATAVTLENLGTQNL